MIVHFFILDSSDLPLFLPKKVSEEPPSASIPVEFPCCNKIKMIAAKAAIAIIATVAIARMSRMSKAVSDANKLINITFCPFFVVFLFGGKPPKRIILYEL